MPLLLRRPHPEEVQTLLRRATIEQPTYTEVGATNRSPLPDGYDHQQQRVRLGNGRPTFDAARHALISWQAHTGAGVHVVPPDATQQPGVTVIVSKRVGPLWMVAPCRIVACTDDGRRSGFAYGTLPGHPEMGEESFVVTIDESGDVDFEITVFSRPVAPLAQVAGPITTAIQRRATARYLSALRIATGG